MTPYIEMNKQSHTAVITQIEDSLKRFIIRVPLAQLLLIVTVILFAVTSCKKLVDVNAPVTSTNADNVFENDATAIAVLTGIYTKLSSGGLVTGLGGTSLNLGLSADEFTIYTGVSDLGLISFYTNSLSTSTAGYKYWSDLYQYIFRCNAAIEGLSSSTALTPSVKSQLLGEARFLRAFFYFHLVTLYGDAPLVITTDYKVNAVLSRSPQADIYQQIISDLTDAQSLLSSSYLSGNLTEYPGNAERVRPTKWAAAALLARAYLYAGNYSASEAQATVLINNTSYFRLQALNDVFLKNSLEAIWQLQPTTLGLNTADGKLFVIPETGLNADFNPVYLSTFLLNAFEVGDVRKVSWIGRYTDTTSNPDIDYFFPFKYKSATLNADITEYVMIFRLAEQYLIRAEARNQLGNINGAKEDLNAIRQRAGLGDTPANDQASLQTAIIHERQVELFTESGHRWLDLKRTNTIDVVMPNVTQFKGGTWNTNWQWYPLPTHDLQTNLNLTQNQGYN